MLLGIFFLVIYGLGSLGVIKRLPLVLMNSNETIPAREVHYHYLIQGKLPVPFKQIQERLFHLGREYPNLHFNVLFLIDNTSRNRRSFPYYRKDDEIFRELRNIRDFNLNCLNINISVVQLTKYMAMTPWRYTWKKIPLSNLIFYLRVFSVWKHGGIGMHLDVLNNQYFSQLADPAITTILKQHSKGIEPKEYIKALSKVDRDEQNELVSLQILYGVVNQILNQSKAFLSIPFAEDGTNEDLPKPFVRTHRDKREASENNENGSDHTNLATDTPKAHLNLSDVAIVDTAYQDNDASEIDRNSVVWSMFGKMQPPNNEIDTLNDTDGSKSSNKSELKVRIPVKNDSEIPQVLLLYDFSIISENIGPLYNPFEPLMPLNLPLMQSDNCEERDVAALKSSKKDSAYFLSIALDGSFVAAASKKHPFLGHIISTACQRTSPRSAIQDVIVTQCSSILNNDRYCSNLFIL